MILIPERKLVLLLVPRTGSGTLKRAVLAKYPQAVMLYRHMEADGVPAGYDRWTKIGVVRDPVARLWSLYKFLRKRGPDNGDYTGHFEGLRASVQRPFEDWLLHNEVIFSSPYDKGEGKFRPQFMALHALPENRKSQFIYLRPDLGTHLWKFNELHELGRWLDVDTDSHFSNYTDSSDVPPLSAEAQAYCRAVFEWDFAVTENVYV